MSPTVTVVGSINIDLVTRTSRLPEPGETVIGGDLRTVPGGKGANQAVAAARLGASVAMVGRVGDDVFAQQLRDNLAAAGVDLTHVSTDGNAASGAALIAVDDQGQNSIVVAPGANAQLTVSDVEAARESIAAADVLLLQLEIPLPTVQRAAELAHTAGTTVILNPAPAQSLPEPLLSLVDVLIPNESETAVLTDLPAQELDELRAAAAALQAGGVATVILTLGQRGALLVDPADERLFPAFTVQRVVDTTAAGDAFVGGLAVALAEGLTLPQALPWGTAAGALAVTRPGAQPSLPQREEIEALLASASQAQRKGESL
ncbi:MAG: ribokinase [Candidatus Promineifilaceae bacterium]|nr:ribokinase [Candidatus Promineifilaceae bacterium]